MKLITKNQKGIGVIAAVLMVAVFLLLIVFATSQYFSNLLVSYQRSTARLIALQVLQDFAVLAQNANSIYVNNAPNCPTGYTQNPSGAPFCWSNTPNFDCIRVPADTNTAVSTAPFCISQPVNGTQSKMDMALWIEPRLTRWQRLQARSLDYLKAAAHFSLIAVQRVLGTTDQTAWAQTPDPSLPSTAGAPTRNISIPPCDTATPGDTNCKRCTGAGKNVDCIMLKVCVNVGGCSSPFEWYQQRVGVISR